MGRLIGFVPWGSSRPVFELLPLLTPVPGTRSAHRLADVIDYKYRLPGGFTFTNGSASVATSHDMTDVLEPGDKIGPEGTALYAVASITPTVVTLTKLFASATVTEVPAWGSRQRITMPFTMNTKFMFPEVGEYGDDILVEILVGGVRTTVDIGIGYKPIVHLEWERLTPLQVEHLAFMLNNRRKVRIQLQPHGDVPIKWIVTPISEFAPEWTGGKLVGTDVVLEFQTVSPVAEIPGQFQGTVRGMAPNNF